MGGIFICYRREDTGPFARLLSQSLADRHALPLADVGWADGLRRLVTALESVVVPFTEVEVESSAPGVESSGAGVEPRGPRSNRRGPGSNTITAGSNAQ